MAARGLLRLSNRLQFGVIDLKSVTISAYRNVHSLNATTSSVLVSKNLLQVPSNDYESIPQRKLHSPCIIQDKGTKLTPDNLSCTQYRYQSFKTNQNVEIECDNENNEEMGAFEKYNLSEGTKKKLRSMGVNHLFPVQYNTFNPTIEGNDVIVQARTGTGKTLSFAIPIVEKLLKTSSVSNNRRRNPTVIILAPTRELANQVKGVFSKLSEEVAVTCVYGGVPIQSQIQTVRNGVDVVVGTPGRVLDLMERRVLNLSGIEHVVLDEVDQMLDMGFSDDVDQIIKDCYTVGSKPQTMLYSATVPSWVLKTAKKYLDNDFKLISLVGKMNEQTATTIKQYAIMCRAIEQPTLIKDLIKLYTDKDGQVIVFCQTKKEADKLSSSVLQKEAKALHGDIAQSSRSHIIECFKKGAFKVLVTTDVAARGLDIPNVDLVIQAQPPSNINFYIHRVGRTGRAGKQGTSILLYEKKEQDLVYECEKAAKIKFENIGLPTLDQLRQVLVKDAVSDVLKVPQGLTKGFEEAAELLVNEIGAVQSLAAALALVSHAQLYQSRSLITSAEGYTTLMYKSGQRDRFNSNMKNMVYTYLQGLNIPVKDFQTLADMTGVVFDVKTENVDAALEGFKEMKMDDMEQMVTIDVLPRIFERGHGDTQPRSYRNKHHNTRQGRNFHFDDEDDVLRNSYQRWSKRQNYKDTGYFSKKQYPRNNRVMNSYDDDDDYFSDQFRPSHRRSQSYKKSHENHFSDNYYSDDD